MVCLTSVVITDCIHVKIHRKHAVACEAFYVALAVPSWATLAMDHKPFYGKPHNIFVDKTLLPE